MQGLSFIKERNREEISGSGYPQSPVEAGQRYVSRRRRTSKTVGALQQRRCTQSARLSNDYGATMSRLITFLGLLAFSVAAAAQTSIASSSDLSGMWLVQDPGSGSFTEWFDNVPKPELRPEIIKDNRALEASARAGNVVNRARRTADCPVGNLPLMMASSPALMIVSAGRSAD